MPMIAIRAAMLQDAPALPEIERSSGSIFSQWEGLEWIANDGVQSEAAHAALISGGLALVAERDQCGIIAFLNGEFASDDLHIWQIAVCRKHQGHGVGRRLIEAARLMAVEKGAAAITLTTFRDVPWNEPYYQRLSFRSLSDPVGPRLGQILRKEAESGLPPALRVAMRMLL